MRRVIKRDGKKEKYDIDRIRRAIQKAVDAVKAQIDIDRVVEDVDRKITKKQITVEEIQDIVEETLVEHKQYKVAKAYILYRKKRAEVRKIAASLGITDAFHLPVNSLQVLASRYLKRDEHRRIIETPRELFWRVAKSIAAAEKHYGATRDDIKTLTQEFFDLISTFRFLPNSPTLMNAGTSLGQLSACFVLPVEDSIEGIFDAIKYTAMIHKSGGGTGFSFSKLRPVGDVVRTTGGIASGPISFMRVFNMTTEVIKQGGKRRGANLGALHVSHPDIFDFVVCKSTEGEFENFNISVGVTNEFMEAVMNDSDYWLINPRTKQKVRKVRARAIWDLIITEAWKTGDPGMLFLDTINESSSNCIPKYGPIETTNPCGEVPLYPYEACNLGSINLSRFVDDSGKIRWNELEETVRLSVRFLDDVIDANHYPIPQIKKMVHRTRRIGLGVMGFADMLIKMRIPYNTGEALRVARKVMSFIEKKAHDESKRLASERGSFPDFEDSIWPEKGYKQLRNCCVTTIAPTGSIGIIANCSSGIEPLFAVAYVRRLSDSLGTDLFEVNPLFEKIAIQEGFYSEALIRKIASKPSIQDVEEVPEEIRKLFVTAHDIDAKWHVMMQATFQESVDNAISKTINFPEWATPHDIENAYILAWRSGCKGITVFRDKCRTRQVLTTGCPECELHV